MTQYSRDWLIAHAHLGPAIIGKGAAAQAAALAKATNNGILGPALLTDTKTPAAPPPAPNESSSNPGASNEKSQQTEKIEKTEKPKTKTSKSSKSPA